MTRPVLRPMRWWDVEPVAALEQELFGPTAWTTELFWSELAAADRWYVVAESVAQPGGRAELLGYAGLLHGGGAEADVQTLAVAPAGRGQGLGTVLLAALLAHAASAGATTVLLEVRADNEPAIRLYERHGFERIAVRRRYYQPGDHDAHIMRLRPLGQGAPLGAPGGSG